MSDGKGWRVAGFFVFLLGAGIILDSAAHGFGGLMAFAGAVLMAWGFFGGGSRPSGSTGVTSAERS